MSRIGKQPVGIPDKVKVEIQGQKVRVEGPKGKLDFELPRRTTAKVEGASVLVSRQGDDAIEIANDTSYGLHAYVSGTDVQRARRVASHLLAGRVAINGMLDDPQAPWGGFKHSGVGREFGTFGIEAFLESRAILE